MYFLTKESCFGIKNWILIFLSVLVFLVYKPQILGLLEGYSTYPFGNTIPRSGWGMGAYINQPTRFTRNQSYDLRGDPVMIRPNPFLSPWGMSGYI